MKSNKVKTLFVVILAFTIGLFLHYSSNPLIALIWLGVYGIAVIFSVAVISIGLFSKKIKLWYFIGLIPITVAFCFETIVRNYKHEKAILLVMQIEKFKNNTGAYPKDLKQIEASNKIDGIKYDVDSDGKNFRIEYLMDGFNKEFFDSDNQRWGTLGFIN